MNKEYTDLELQLWLGKQLSEEIFINQKGYDTSSTIFGWRHKEDVHGYKLNVTSGEWDYITRQLEQKLTEDQYDEYVNLLDDATRYNHNHNSEAVRAPWQVRAAVMMEMTQAKE